MSLPVLLEEIRACTVCADELLDGPRPIVQVDSTARIVLIGQAPGRRVHLSGIPWDDPSGRTLRTWLGVTEEQFYDPKLFGIVPMGFCYPGKASSGDKPPRPERDADRLNAPNMRLECTPTLHRARQNEVGLNYRRECSPGAFNPRQNGVGVGARSGRRLGHFPQH